MKYFSEKFIGSTIVFGVSDPWDFYVEHGDKKYSAIGKAVSSESLLLELTTPFQYKGVICKHMVATARHADKSLLDVTTSHAVPVNLIPAMWSSFETIMEPHQSHADAAPPMPLK